MGKSRRDRNKGPRSDPIAKPVKPLSDPELIALRESRILPVVKDLQSPDPKSRKARGRRHCEHCPGYKRAGSCCSGSRLCASS